MKIEYKNFYSHYVLTCFGRLSLIPEKNRIRIEKYITGIVSKNNARLYAVYVNPDHTHILVSRDPYRDDEELLTIIADSSAKFINENKLSVGKFAWQESASGFSVSKSDVDRVCKYILNQGEHHKKTTFAEEYDKFLKHYQETLNKNINDENK